MTILVAIAMLHLLVQSILLVRTMLTVPRLSASSRPGSPGDPLVSVVVPARDEESMVEAAVASRLQDPDQALEFLLVDDRSSDATGQILDRISDRDPRVSTLHVDSLPEGWLGKVHAMEVGMQHARGDWVLLSDADVHVAPGMVRSAVDLATRQGLDHLAAIPAINSPSIGLRMCLLPLLKALINAVKLWSVNNPNSRAAMGVGAFNLVHRSTFEAAGGLEALRMEVADDVGVGVLIKEHGGSSRVVVTRDLEIAWYETFGDFMRAMERITAKRPRWCPRWLLSLAIMLLLFVQVAPFICLLAWPWSSLLGWLGLGTSLWLVGFTVALAHRFGFPKLPASLVPIGSVLCALVAVRAALVGGRGGSIQWRGTTYEIDALREGERVRLHPGKPES